MPIDRVYVNAYNWDMQTPLDVEKVAAALTLANGNVSEAARMLGVSRVTIYKWKLRIPKKAA